MYSLMLLLACHGADPALGEVMVSLAEQVQGPVIVGWSSEIPGKSWVRWGEGEDLAAEDLNQLTPTQEVSVGPQRNLLLGAQLGRPLSLQLVLEDDAGEEHLGEVLTVEMPLAPAGLPEIYTSGQLPEGYVITAVVTDEESWVVVLDGDAVPVWVLPDASGRIVSSLKQSVSGGLSFLVGTTSADEEGPNVLRVDAEGRVLSDLQLPKGHHDFAELSDGRIAWLTYEDHVLDVDGEPRKLTLDGIMVAEPEQLDSPQRLFSMAWDWVDQPIICEHQELETYTGGLDWTHANSLVYDPEQELLHILPFHVDTLLSVSLADGEIADIVGGPHSWHPLEGEGFGWSHGHTSNVSAGRMLMFDNSLHRVPKQSRAIAWSWSTDGNLVMDWSYEEPKGRTVAALGDADWMPNDMVLITWSTIGTLSVVDPSGTALWTAETELGAGFSRSLFVEDLYAALQVEQPR